MLKRYRLFFDNIIQGDKETVYKLFKLATFAVIALACLSFILFIFLLADFDASKFGALGDFFGGFLNPVLTFITFMVLLFTIFNQSEELKLTRKELEISTKELEKSASALKGQEQLLKHQQFETTFFNLLKLKDTVFNDIIIGNFIMTTKNGDKIRDYHGNINGLFDFLNKYELNKDFESYRSVILTAEGYFYALSNITQLIHGLETDIQNTYFNYLISSLKYEEKLFILEVSENIGLFDNGFFSDNKLGLLVRQPAFKAFIKNTQFVQ